MAVGALGALDFQVGVRDAFTSPLRKMFNASTMLDDSMTQLKAVIHEFNDAEIISTIRMGAKNLMMVVLAKNVWEYSSATLASNMAMARGVTDTAALFFEQSRLRLMYGATAEEVATLTASTSLLKLSGNSMRDFNKATLMLGATTNLGIKGAASLSEFLVRDLGVSVDKLLPAFDQLSKTIRSVGISGTEAADALRGASGTLARMSEDARGKALPAFIKIAGAFKTLGVDANAASGMINSMMDVTSSGGVLLASKIGSAMGKTGEEMRRGLADGTIQADDAMKAFVNTLQVGTKAAPMSALMIKIRAKMYGIEEKEFTKLVRAKESGRAATMWENKATMGLVATYRLLADPMKRYGTMALEAVTWIGGMAGAVNNINNLMKSETAIKVANTAVTWARTTAMGSESLATMSLAAAGEESFLMKTKNFAMDIKTIAIQKMQNLWTVLTTASTWNLNAAMAANPIGAVVVAVVALVAVLAYLWNKFEVGSLLLDELKSAFQPVMDAFEDIKGAVGELMAPFAGLFNFGGKAGGMFKILQDVIRVMLKVSFFPLRVVFFAISGIMKGIAWVIHGVAVGFKKLGSNILWFLGPIGWAVKIFTLLWKKFDVGVKISSTLAHVWERMAKAWSAIKSFLHMDGGQEPPKMASGGIVTRATMATVGEAGPEAIIPLGGARAAQYLGGTGSRDVVNAIERLIEITKKRSNDSGSGNMDLGMDYPIYRLIGGYGV